MNIKEIQNNGYSIDPVEEKRKIEKPGDREEKVESDSVELSREAKKLYEMRKAEKYEKIRKKIDEKFYDSPEVSDKVAEAILKEFESSRF